MDKFIAWLDKIIDATAWQVPAPRSYGPFHITFTLVGFFLCALIAWKLRNVNEKQSRRVIFTTGMILVFLEVQLVQLHLESPVILELLEALLDLLDLELLVVLVDLVVLLLL